MSVRADRAAAGADPAGQDRAGPGHPDDRGTLRLWAPSARRVDALIDRSDHGPDRRALRASTGGWWTGRWPDVGRGTSYRFSVDDGPAVADPRSADQPQGVHGPSRVVDHAAFAWSDGDWRAGPLLDAVIYELHVGTFSRQGTFDGAIEHLDHLVDLGVTHLELMPVNAFPGVRGWGYDGVGLFAPHAPYGGPDGLKRLVDACHGRGLAVLIDVVYNHFGPDGNAAAAVGPYLTERYRTPWGAAVNFDGPGSDEVRRFVVDNALAWLRDYHADGLRIDAVHAIFDRSATHILEQLATETAALAVALGRPLVLIAESDGNDPRLVRDARVGGYGLDATWNDDVHHAIHVAMTGEQTGYYEDFTGLPDLARALAEVYAYAGRYSVHRGRTHGRPADGLPAGRFVAFSQNHDQVGNRAKGERLAHLAGDRAARVAAGLVLAGPFIPLLFQGEEWAASTPFQYFTDHVNPDLAAAVREGRRSEFAAFGWRPEDVPDPQMAETFERSRLRWAERHEPGHAEMLAWYRRLIELRRATPSLRDGRRPEVTADLESGWLALDRGDALVIANLGAAAVTVPSAGSRDRARTWHLAAASAPEVVAGPAGVGLPPMSIAVLTRTVPSGPPDG